MGSELVRSREVVRPFPSIAIVKDLSLLRCRTACRLMGSELWGIEIMDRLFFLFFLEK